MSAILAYEINYMHALQNAAILLGLVLISSGEMALTKGLKTVAANRFITRSQAVARIADRTAKNCRRHMT